MEEWSVAGNDGEVYLSESEIEAEEMTMCANGATARISWDRDATRGLTLR
jgi:hypothetical protein